MSFAKFSFKPAPKPVFCAPKPILHLPKVPVFHPPKPVVLPKPIFSKICLGKDLTPVKPLPMPKPVQPCSKAALKAALCGKKGAIVDKKGDLLEKLIGKKANLLAKKSALLEKLAALKAKCLPKHPVKDEDEDEDDGKDHPKDPDEGKDNDNTGDTGHAPLVDKDTAGITFHIDENGDGSANVYLDIYKGGSIDRSEIDFQTYLDELKVEMAEQYPHLDPAQAVIKAQIYNDAGETKFYYFNGTEFEEVDDARFYEEFAQDFGTVPDEAEVAEEDEEELEFA